MNPGLRPDLMLRGFNGGSIADKIWVNQVHLGHIEEREKKMEGEKIRVRVKFFAYYREVFGAREKELVVGRGATLAEVLGRIVETPQQEKEIFSEGQLKPQVVIMINGSVVPAEALPSRQLEDHSVVAIFPMMGGG